MFIDRLPILYLASVLMLTAATSVSIAETSSPAIDEITQTASAFVEAFEKGDAEAVAAFWTQDGDYIDATGQVFAGRPAIQAEFEKLFAAQKSLRLRIDIDAIRFPTPDTAIEDGITTVTPSDGSDPARSRYTNVLVKEGGQWLLSSVRESVYTPPSQAEHLSPLAWMVGDWTQAPADSKAPVATIRVLPGPNANFLISHRGVAFKDALHLTTTEWIGWDPVKKEVRSWTFETDGGYGESVWQQEKESWKIDSVSTLPTGESVKSTTTLTWVDDTTFTVQSTNQSIDGKSMPDGPVIRLTRATDTPID